MKDNAGDERCISAVVLDINRRSAVLGLLLEVGNEPAAGNRSITGFSSGLRGTTNNLSRE
jgi:hypothetical protein